MLVRSVLVGAVVLAAGVVGAPPAAAGCAEPTTVCYVECLANKPLPEASTDPRELSRNLGAYLTCPR